MSTDSPSPETALQVNVRYRIEHGGLPRGRPREIAAGYGSGSICAACDQPITHRQVEYEVEDAETAKKLCFHAECHDLWQTECSKVSPAN